MTETCGTCDYYQTPEKGAPMGTCWRYPPVPASFPVPMPPNAIQIAKGGGPGPPGASIITFQVRPPVTDKTLCCGEWAGYIETGELPAGGPPTFKAPKTDPPDDGA